jgi:hypothetical protein
MVSNISNVNLDKVDGEIDTIMSAIKDVLEKDAPVSAIKIDQLPPVAENQVSENIQKRMQVY